MTPDAPGTAPAPGAGGTWRPSEHELERRRVRATLRRRSLVVASVVTVLFFVAVAFGVTQLPGWERVKETFFSAEHARESFPQILSGFWLNVKMFLIAEPLILLLGLAVALTRQSRSALMTPVRLLATAYTDLFRGVPTILLVLLCGFGIPALGLVGVTNDLFFWALVALVLSYGAYVAEVFRAGIESIHPSQWASAEALGLSRFQAMRHVIVPQAIRRVGPPLLNDFVSLQKDTALVSTIGIFDAVFSARDYGNYHFNYTAMVVVACFFVVITIPLARLTDHLQRRTVERERAGAR